MQGYAQAGELRQRAGCEVVLFMFNTLGLYVLIIRGMFICFLGLHGYSG